MAQQEQRLINIGMIGGGTVGGGVYEIITNRLSDRCRIRTICVHSLAKSRTFHIDERLTKLTTTVDDVINDPTIDIVVEVMGGTDLARTVVLRALTSNKHVVTANKALVAQHLDELHRAASLQRGKGTLSYEAAVCGGIPIIATLQTCYTGDVLHQVMGICNGTTNYMLGKMESEGVAYADVLKEAQDLGYAEADPTADVEGHDVRAKICILSKLAFGKTVDPSRVSCQGITQITATDFDYASNLLQCTIKLVGVAVRLGKYGEHDGPLSVYVAPHVVAKSNLLASAEGSGNAIVITSANMGTTSYTGPGAGRYPTANSVVADIVRICDNLVGHDPFPTPVEQQTSSSSSSSTSVMEVEYDYTSAFYIRIPFVDSLGIIHKIGQLAERHGVSIHSILQNPIKDRMTANFVITTEECKRSQVDALCEDINKEEFTRSVPLCMPLLMDLH